MTFETVVPEMLSQFPHLREDCLGYMDENEPLAYIAFGCVLLPALEKALADDDMLFVKAVCDFIERGANGSVTDGHLANLLGVEVGEWLPSAPRQDVLSALLGPNTKRLCSFIPR